MIRTATPVLLLVLLASPALAASDYVVLSGVPDGDPYAAAAKLLARHHEAKVIRFDPDRPEAVLPALLKESPVNVAVVLKPAQIHVNTVRRFLRAATKLDDDPFPDFSFGYVTGATAEEALRFVANIVRASKVEIPRRVARAAVMGGEAKSRAADGTLRAGKLAFPQRQLWFGKPPEGAERDQAFIDRELPSIEGAGAILMGGHGMPWEIGRGPRAEDVAKLDLFPAVAMNYACYTGVTGRWPERKYEAGKYLHRLNDLGDRPSFALAMIRAGVTGYVAYVNPRPAGPETSIDFQRVLAGSTLGDARRADYAKVVLGYLGFGEPGIVVGDWPDGERVPVSEVDAVRDMMLDGATGGILFGDPAFRPFPVVEDGLPLTVATEVRDGDLHVTMKVEAQWFYVFCCDPFRRAGGKEMAMKAYGRIPLPEGGAAIRHVFAVSAAKGGTRLETLPPVWAIEEDRGRRYLHLKAGFRRPEPTVRGGLTVRLVATAKDRPPPAPATPPAKEEDWRARAVETGEILLGRLDELDSPDVYEGAAGTAILFMDLYRATGEWRFREAARTLIDRALAAEVTAPGLYTGLAGVGQVALDAAFALGDRGLLREARRCAERLGDPEATDVISGAAGTGFFLLDLHAATGDERWLREAEKLGRYLEKHAVREKGAARWPVAPGSDRVYIGFSHGAAGIGTFLLHLGMATGDAKWRKLAEEAAEFVIRCAKEDGADGWKWTKMEPPRKQAWPVQWCHGSPGIGLFFLDLAEHVGGETYERALARCVASTLREGRTARVGGCQCHGAGGNAELLLEVYRRSGDESLLEAARTWATDLVGADGVVTTIGRYRYDAGYMTGLAGIGHFFLRLADPRGVDLPLMPPNR